MTNTVERCAAALRRGATAEGQEALVELVDRVAAAWEANPDGDLLPLLQRLLAAQERADYLFVADLVQYELGPRLTER